MILNIGPDARGNFPETAVEELRKVGAWLSKNGCSIYNCGHSEIENPNGEGIRSRLKCGG